MGAEHQMASVEDIEFQYYERVPPKQGRRVEPRILRVRGRNFYGIGVEVSRHPLCKPVSRESPHSVSLERHSLGFATEPVTGFVKEPLTRFR